MLIMGHGERRAKFAAPLSSPVRACTHTQGCDDNKNKAAHGNKG
jgi:hypothetical protein